MHTLRLLGIRFKTADPTQDCNPGGKTLHIHVKKNHNEEQMIPLNEKEKVMKQLCNADQHRLAMLLEGYDEKRVKMAHVNFIKWFEKRRERMEQKKAETARAKKLAEKEKLENARQLFDESTR